MQYWEILLLCFGLSLDVFAVSVCHGALLPRFNAGKMSVMALIFCGVQTAALACGLGLSCFSKLVSASAMTLSVWRVISALIFLALAVVLLVRGIRKRPFFEHRSEIKYGNVLLTSVLTAVDALMVGLGSGLMEQRWLLSLITLFAVTALCVFSGAAVGYHFGYEHKNTAYWVGSALFLAVAADMFIRLL